MSTTLLRNHGSLRDIARMTLKSGAHWAICLVVLMACNPDEEAGDPLPKTPENVVTVVVKSCPPNKQERCIHPEHPECIAVHECTPNGDRWGVCRCVPPESDSELKGAIAQLLYHGIFVHNRSLIADIEVKQHISRCGILTLLYTWPGAILRVGGVCPRCRNRARGMTVRRARRYRSINVLSLF